jgi:hypothetical protein
MDDVAHGTEPHDEDAFHLWQLRSLTERKLPEEPPNASGFSPEPGFGSAGDLVAGRFRAENKWRSLKVTLP